MFAYCCTKEKGFTVMCIAKCRKALKIISFIDFKDQNLGFFPSTSFTFHFEIDHILGENQKFKDDFV